MPAFHRLIPIILLTAGSLAGNHFYRSFARGGTDRARLVGLAADNLARLPEAIGSWNMQTSEPLSDDVLRVLDCRAYQSRLYTDKATGDQVALILLAGSPGPLVAHTPEVCYASSGLAIADTVGSDIVRGTGAQADTFRRAAVVSKSVEQKRRTVYYAWRTFDGSWQAPDHPRLALGGAPMLYKLQLATDTPLQSDGSSEADPARRFLKDLLPALDQALKLR